MSAVLSLGAATGPLIFGNMTDRIGRKYTILATGIPILIGYLLLAFTKSKNIFYVGRFLCGLSAGGVFNNIPVYIGEIASNHNRGSLCALLSAFNCAGTLFSYCVGPYVNVITFNMILAVFPLIFIVLFWIIGPESAYYFEKINERNLAREALKKVRSNIDEVEEELDLIHKKIKQEGEGTFLDIFKEKKLRRAFFIMLGLMFCQQFSGIVAVIYYAQTIFKLAEVRLDPALSSIIIGVVQFITSFLTPLISDKLGRKKLLMASSIGMIISEGPLGAYCFLKDLDYDVSYLSLLPIICLMVYIISFNFGFAHLPWTIMSEIFPTNVKIPATLFGTFLCNTLAFLIAKFFQTFVIVIGLGTSFWVFTTACVISIPFIHFVVIETKGKSLFKIQEDLEK